MIRVQFGETLEKIKNEEIRSFYERASDQLELEGLKQQLAEVQQRDKTHHAEAQKLRRTIKYWKSQAKLHKGES